MLTPAATHVQMSMTKAHTNLDARNVLPAGARRGKAVNKAHMALAVLEAKHREELFEDPVRLVHEVMTTPDPIPFVESVATPPVLVPRMSAALTDEQVLEAAVEAAEQKKIAQKARLMKQLETNIDTAALYKKIEHETPVMKIADMLTPGYYDRVPPSGLRIGAPCLALFNYDPDNQVDVPIYGRMSNWYKGTVRSMNKDSITIHFEADGKLAPFHIVKHVVWGVLRFA